MTATMDSITFWVFVLLWPVWLAWELVLLRLRAVEQDKPKTISMVARDLGWKASSIVYVWGGLATHFWWTAPGWAPAWSAVIFWFLAAALLVEDAALWGSDRSTWKGWVQVQRFPPLILGAGLLAGRLLFPQIAGV
jgi:hypothetical protein